MMLPWFIPIFRVVVVVTIVQAAVLLGIGGYLCNSTRVFLATAVACRGQVVEMIVVHGDDGETYAPAFTFTDASGTPRRGSSRVSSNPAAYSVGDAIALRYDPNHPADVRVDTFWGLWAAPVVLFFSASVSLVIGLAFYFFGPWMVRRKLARGDANSSGLPSP